MRREKRHTGPAGQPITARGRNRLETIFLEAWRPYAWIAGVIVALYGITLTFPFVFDDIQLVKDNFILLGDFKNILKAFTLDVFWKTPGSYYRPALTVSLMIDAVLGGQHPAWYHATNILLHCACAALVFRLLLRLACPRPLAFVLGMVFAVHPVMVQAVAWVAGRNDLLMTLFAVASLLAFLRFAQEGKWRYFIFSCALLLLAVLSKESAVALPLLMMGYILFVAGRRPAPRAIVAAAAGQALVIAAYLLLRRNALGSGFSPHEFNSAAENCVGVFGYIGKLLFPFGLSTLPAPESVSPLWGPLAAALIIVLFLAGRVVNRWLFLFGCGWFIVFLIPTVARITPFANFLEHRLYLPLVGCLMMLAVSRWLRNLLRSTGRAVLCAALAAVAFGAATVHHLPAFASNQAFWTNAAETSPHCYFPYLMLVNLADYSSRPADAERCLQRSLVLSPNRPAYNELGHLYEITGATRKAISSYTAGLKRYPGDKTLLTNLWFLYLKEQKHDSAIAVLRDGLARMPSDPDILYHLGFTFFEMDSIDRAAVYFQRSLAAEPRFAPSYERLALIAYRRHDFASAVSNYDKAVAYGYQRSPDIEEMLAPYR